MLCRYTLFHRVPAIWQTLSLRPTKLCTYISYCKICSAWLSQFAARFSRRRVRLVCRRERIGKHTHTRTNTHTHKHTHTHARTHARSPKQQHECFVYNYRSLFIDFLLALSKYRVTTPIIMLRSSPRAVQVSLILAKQPPLLRYLINYWSLPRYSAVTQSNRWRHWLDDTISPEYMRYRLYYLGKSLVFMTTTILNLK